MIYKFLLPKSPILTQKQERHDFFKTKPKCDLRGVHHADGTPSFDKKLVCNVLGSGFAR